MKHLTDDEWKTELFLALTAANASEREVTEAMADVESFCADSGQSPAEAFGENPRAYVQRLGVGHRTSWREVAEHAIHVPTLLGIFVVLDAAQRVATGEPFTLRWGHLAAAAILCVTTFAFFTLFFRGRKVLTWLAGAAGMAATVLAAVYVTAPITSFAAWFALGGGIALMAVPATVNTVQALRAEPVAQDIDPSAERPSTWVIVAAHYGVVVVALVCATVLALVLRGEA
ncbi:MAG: hypothetical protein GX593_12655 [Actinomycetales bacterium]|nr:hypothetical protein [Actinomycetales bacterium]